VSNAGAQAVKFYEDVATNKSLWFAATEDGQLLEFDVKDDRVSIPLWSSKSRIVRLKKMNPEFLCAFSPREATWIQFIESFAPMIREKNRLIGVNLSGKNISGFDMEVDYVIAQVEGFLS